MYWAKKLVAVLAILMSVTANLEALYKAPYIWYSIQFLKGHFKLKAFIDFNTSEINIMTIAFTTKLGLKPKLTNVGV